MGKLKISLILIIPIMFCADVFAQQIGNTKYLKETELYYGIVYQPQDFNAIGHPFFKLDELFGAQVDFKGEAVSNLQMKYDLYNQVLVLYLRNSIDQYRFMKLNPDLIKSFELFDEREKSYKFISNTFEEKFNANIAYYEIIYSNKVSYYIGREKKLNELVVDNKNKFSQNEEHYIKSNRNLVHISNRRDFLKFFGDDKKKIKAYAKENDIKINLKNVKNIVRLIKFYESFKFKN